MPSPASPSPCPKILVSRKHTWARKRAPHRSVLSLHPSLTSTSRFSPPTSNVSQPPHAVHLNEPRVSAGRGVRDRKDSAARRTRREFPVAIDQLPVRGPLFMSLTFWSYASVFLAPGPCHAVHLNEPRVLHAASLATGKIALSGESRSLSEDPRIKRSYLGA